jgi:hypothetical protein
MSDLTWIGPTIAALSAAVIGILNHLDLKAAKEDLRTNTKKTDDTNVKLNDVHHQINSRMDQLLELTKAAAHAAGVKEEKDKLS